MKDKPESEQKDMQDELYELEALLPELQSKVHLCISLLAAVSNDIKACGHWPVQHSYSKTFLKVYKKRS